MGTDLRKEKVKCALTSTGLLMEGVERKGHAESDFFRTEFSAM
jgi:hypothetical protein